jgi:hypothetical protein
MENKIDQEPVDRHAIREIHRYVDDKRREVMEFAPVFGKQKVAPFYKGRAVVKVKVESQQGIPLPPQNQQFEFDIEASGIRKAFEMFDDAAQEYLDKFMAAQKERSRIVTARGMPSLVGPGGKPV